uniref:Uncharacterized protein n=1 Tax=Oryza barthii TaxID=65489 RepID=A0A0D3HKZ5_9ORYZ
MESSTAIPAGGDQDGDIYEKGLGPHKLPFEISIRLRGVPLLRPEDYVLNMKNGKVALVIVPEYAFGFCPPNNPVIHEVELAPFCEGHPKSV